MTNRTIGPYELQGLLGTGGMGEVYRARDLRLGRDVAIKMLPLDMAADPDRLARFEREARVLASLNHPNIATIYGIEAADGVRAIVMELIAGETLAERIASARGARGLPLNEALSWARQIGDALDAAHERGIIHRDLKPANIKITPDGVVKVLDFGIAKSVAQAYGTQAANSAGTITVEGTREGTVIGTAAYMSPEQARGQGVDKRTDIWAFGCVLYETLTGRRAFGGGTHSDTIAAVLQHDPDWEALPPSTPAGVRRLLERCLDKDLKRRQRDIGDARRDLEPADEAATKGDARTRRLWPWLGWVVAITAMAFAAVGWSVAVARRASPGQSAEHVLTRITWDGDFAVEPALSPDGSLIVYASDAGGQRNLDLWVQRVAGGTAVRLTSDEADDRAPDFSPDGTAVAFRSERAGGGVYVMPALGGDARLIAPGGRDPRFSPDGTHIAYWTGGILGGTRGDGTSILVSPANGGSAQRLSTEFISARRPVWSPDGGRLLFFGRRLAPATASRRTIGPNMSAVLDREFDWWSLPAQGGESVATGVYPSLRARGISFAPDTGGDALPDSWGADGVLFSGTTGQATNVWRVKVSPVIGKIDGDPVRLTTGTGADRHASVDKFGHIVFQVSRSNEAVLSLALEPETAKSSGAIERLATGWEFGVHRGSVSQDGRMLAYPRHRPRLSELWVKDLATGAAHHLVTTPATQLNPITSDDGSQVAYTVIEHERSAGYVVATAGGPVRKVCDDCTPHVWLNDSRRIVVEFRGTHPALRVLDTANQTMEDLFDVDQPLQRVFVTADNRWIAIGAANLAWILSLRPGHLATPESAVVTELPHSDVTSNRVCGWSPDGRRLYSLLGVDGFRCLYAQGVDPTGATPPGLPVVVHHFHDPERVWGSTPMGNAITRRGFVFDQVETSASIWLLDPRPTR
jgi:eukaryotic-like serine/threonine-protein kinase